VSGSDRVHGQTARFVRCCRQSGHFVGLDGRAAHLETGILLLLWWRMMVGMTMTVVIENTQVDGQGNHKRGSRNKG